MKSVNTLHPFDHKNTQPNSKHCLSHFQISVMQSELTALQPKLIENSKETDKLIIIVQEETKEVDAKRQIVAADEAEANAAAKEAQGIKVILSSSQT